MAYDPGALDSNLAAAVGDDPALVTELRYAFLDGVAAHLDALTYASGSDAWRAAAARLAGLAASFGASDLMHLALGAGDAPPGDAAALDALSNEIACLQL